MQEIKIELKEENGNIYYYEDGVPVHKGAVEIDGTIYYAGKNGKIATGYHVVHSTMANDLLKHGTYLFAQDGKLVEGSYVPPEKTEKNTENDKKKTKELIIKEIKKRKWIIVMLALFLVMVAAAYGIDRRAAQNEALNDIEDIDETAAEADLYIAPYDSETYLCTEAAEKFYEGNISIDSAIRQNSGENSAYKGFDFEYTLSGEGDLTLEIDDNEEMKSPKKFDMSPEEQMLTIDNLVPGTTYYYRVTLNEKNKTTEYRGSFVTAKSARFLNIPDLKNVRDIGGYETSNGKKIQYGMLIRGTEPDGLVVNGYFLKDMNAVDEFGFKSDIDLRNAKLFSGGYSNRFGDSVVHKTYAFSADDDVLSEENREALKQGFADLASPESYPVYLHCTNGASRTGVTVFLLQSILGVSEEDMKTEYMLSGFAEKSVDVSDLNPVYAQVESMPGATINEQAANYLINVVGVSIDEITSIRNILLK